MTPDAMAKLRELAASIGKPDFLQVAERVGRDLAVPATPAPKGIAAMKGVPRRPATVRVKG